MLAILKNIAPQVSMTDSGGRVKPLPIQNPAYLSDITEVGHYYIYTQDTQNALDFPLPKAFRDAGWFFDVLPGHYNGALRQVLTRNSTGRNMLKFERVIDIFNKKTTEHGISVRKTPVIGNISLRILQNYQI